MGYSCGYISLKKGIRTAYINYATQEKNREKKYVSFGVHKNATQKFRK